ncbi:MAG: sulfur carrier protein ThiS, partial [Planctomycetota bacterium]
MRVRVNGEDREVAAGTTVAGLLVELGLDKAVCAAEVNKQLVPARRRDTHALSEGDQIEIVTLVGG